jgi:uncharacterized protein (UPF0335 family)
MSAKKATGKKPAKVRKPRPKKKTKAERMTEAEDLLQRIEAAEVACEETQCRMSEIKQEYKEAKEAHGFNVTELRRLCRARKEKLPLFDAAKQQELPKAGETSADVPDENRPIDKDAWKSLPVGDLKLPAKIAKAIVDAGHTTIGSLSVHMADQGDWWAKQIKGIGEKARDEVCDAFADFWKEHPEYCTIPTIETAEPEECEQN